MQQQVTGMESNSTFWNFNGELEHVDKWLLMGSPVPTLIIWVLYLLFVLKWGPEYMKKRAPFKLNNTITVYNAVQVIISAFILFLGTKSLLAHGIYPKCLHKQDMHYLSILHYYFLAKITELLDTIFFVLRKKQNQATFLHIYHHAYMVGFVWLTIKYDPSYMTLLPATLNCLIHVVMYAYYGMSAFPSLARYLWWKRYLTTMQLVQFIVILTHVATSYLVMECPPSFTLTLVMLLNGASFLTLFGDFYIKEYLKKKNNKGRSVATIGINAVRNGSCCVNHGSI